MAMGAGAAAGGVAAGGAAVGGAAAGGAAAVGAAVVFTAGAGVLLGSTQLPPSQTRSPLQSVSLVHCAWATPTPSSTQAPAINPTKLRNMAVTLLGRGDSNKHPWWVSTPILNPWVPGLGTGFR